MSDADIDKAVKEAAEFEARIRREKKRSIQETKLMRWYSRQKNDIKEVGANWMTADKYFCRS